MTLISVYALALIYAYDDDLCLSLSLDLCHELCHELDSV